MIQTQRVLHITSIDMVCKCGKDLRRDLETMCEEDVALMCRACCLAASRQVLEGLRALPAVCPTPLSCTHHLSSSEGLRLEFIISVSYKFSWHHELTRQTA